MKTCCLCRACKPRSEFNRDRSSRDGLDSRCRSCNRAHCQRWSELNRDRTREKARAWAAAHPERARQNVKAWHEANRERVRVNQQRWHAENRERHRQYNAKREAHKRGNGAERVDYAAILERDGYTWHLCKTAIASRDDLHFDHVIPLSRGGAHRADNIKVAHADCNRRKHNKLPTEAVI